MPGLSLSVVLHAIYLTFSSFSVLSVCSISSSPRLTSLFVQLTVLLIRMDPECSSSSLLRTALRFLFQVISTGCLFDLLILRLTSSFILCCFLSISMSFSISEYCNVIFLTSYTASLRITAPHTNQSISFTLFSLCCSCAILGFCSTYFLRPLLLRAMRLSPCTYRCWIFAT